MRISNLASPRNLILAPHPSHDKSPKQSPVSGLTGYLVRFGRPALLAPEDLEVMGTLPFRPLAVCVAHHWDTALSCFPLFRSDRSFLSPLLVPLIASTFTRWITQGSVLGSLVFSVQIYFFLISFSFNNEHPY